MTVKTVDALLVGAGAMSTTLATMLNKLDPSLDICMVERLDHVAHESTDGWNNAGTGHAAYCELNYTPEVGKNDVNIDKALAINSAFEVTLQFWSHLVKTGSLPEPENFINRTPHMSFVWGKKNVAFLKKRYELMSAHHLFQGMEYSEDPAVLEQWMPLVMNGRKAGQPVAATRVNHGSDCDFGSLARLMVSNLEKQDSFELKLAHSVEDLQRSSQGGWSVLLKDEKTDKITRVRAKFVFLGAGGGALPLLQKSEIPESNGYGGFPVSGQWMVCENEEVIEQHHAKVYGKAAIGAPPMSVPHLDTRVINGKKALLFGPYAGFTTKFLKHGSVMDLPGSIQTDNLKPMVSVGLNNMDLTKYLISEVFQSMKSRMSSLKDYLPEAQDKDWKLANAGQRVQIIKKDAKGKGSLEFGTEIVSCEDGTLAALLGASPGASTATQTMIDVIERCFSEQLENNGWKEKMAEMIPSYGQSLIDDGELLAQVRQMTLETLKLNS
jgi:malate dehydrogenase (quinone)